MRVNTAKQKMLQAQPAFGYGLGLGSPLVAEVLAHSGIDFILIDGQHGSFGVDSTISSFLAVAAGSAIPMIRVARNDFTYIGHALDAGALGVVIPMIETAADGRAAAAACRFPPQGSRSWGWGRALSLGDDYADGINDQVFVAVQIESLRAVQNAEAIMAVPGIDGCWIGPGDLALSMGIHPRQAAADERHQRAVEQVLQACRDTGKIPGIAAPTAEDARQRAEQGFRFVTAGSDLRFLLDGARAALQLLRSAEYR